MNNEPSEKARLLHAAADLPDLDRRKAFLDAACGEDHALRAEIEAQLARDTPTDDFREQSAEIGTPYGACTGRILTRSIERPGEVIAGRYTLIESIGEGGMGTVWSAEQTQPVRRKVAVKLIKPGMDSKPILARFDAERQALALMDHPNIAKVLDGGVTDQSRPFFVMEYVNGIPLTKYCDDARLPVNDRLQLFGEVCQAVQHAHQKGIIHRDLKPSNILVCLYDGRPVPKVIDFGLAKAMHQPLTEQAPLTAHGVMLGTPLYMSPEQAEFNNLDVDARTDIYSLGVILYELLTGRTPLERVQLQQAALQEMLRLIREEEPVKPSTRLSGSANLRSVAAQRGLEPAQLRRSLQGDLDWITMKALEKEPGRRYPTANALARDLERYLHDEPVEASPPSSAYRLRKFVKRNRGQVIAASLVLLALVGGIIGTTIGLLEARQQRDAADVARLAEAGERKKAIKERDEKEKALRAEEAQRAIAEIQKTAAETATDEANAERAVVAAVNNFVLNALLGQADVANQPFGLRQPRDRDVKVRTLLDRAAKAVEGKFTEQPLTEAAIRLTLGNTYRGLGEGGLAIPHLERAVSLRTAELGSDHPDTLTAEFNLAVLHQALGQFEQAERDYMGVVNGQTARLGESHIDTLATKRHLADLHQTMGKDDLAVQEYLAVLEAQTATLGDGHLQTLATRHSLALLYDSQGKFEMAEQIFQAVLDAATARLGPDHPNTLFTQKSLAQLYAKHGRLVEAERMYLAVLELESAQGADHPSTLNTKVSLADVYSLQARYDLAEPIYHAALEAQSEKLGADHPDALHTRKSLASLYMHRKKYELAEKTYLAALESQSARFGPENAADIEIKSNMANLYQEWGKLAKAEELLQELMETLTAKVGANHMLTLQNQVALATLYLRQRKVGQAEALFAAVVEKADATFGVTHPFTQTAKGNLALIYIGRKRYDEAESLLQDVLKVDLAQRGPDHPHTSITRNALAWLYHSQGKYAEAEPQFVDRLRWARPGLGLEDGNTQACIQGLIDCYVHLDQPAKAEPLYRERAELVKGKAGPESSQYAAELASLGANLVKQEKWAEGESILRECLAIREKKDPDAWTTFNTQSLLGGCLLGQKNFTAAEPLLLAGYEGMRHRESRIAAAAKSQLTDALERLVRLYDEWEKQDEANRWRKTLEEVQASR